MDQLGINWDSRLHMAVLQIIEEGKTFRNHLKPSQPAVSIPAAKSVDPERKQTWTVTLKHKTTICAVLSPSHTIQLQSGNYLNINTMIVAKLYCNVCRGLEGDSQRPSQYDL